MKPVEVREELVDALRLDLIGPCPTRNLGTPDEVLPQTPSRWYLTGFLVPLERRRAAKGGGRGDRRDGRPVQRFRRWLETRQQAAPNAPLFPLRTSGGCWRKTSKMMRMDLERAGLPYVDENGLFADFHGHRHTFITNLGKAEVPLAMAQKLARHSDPKLTANTYTHLGVFDKAGAIGRLPSLPDPSGDAEKGQQLLRATGTDDAQPTTTYGGGKGEHFGQQSAGKS